MQILQRENGNESVTKAFSVSQLELDSVDEEQAKNGSSEQVNEKNK